LQQRTSTATVHHAAAVVIGRRALGHRARRRPHVPTGDQRIAAVESCGSGRSPNRGRSGTRPSGIRLRSGIEPHQTDSGDRNRSGDQAVQHRSGRPGANTQALRRQGRLRWWCTRLSGGSGRMVNRWAPGREGVERLLEEAVTGGDAGGAVLAGAAALGRRPAGPAGRRAAAPPATPGAAAAHQAGPLTDASGGPFRRVSVAPRWRGSCRVRSARSDAGGGGGAVAVLVLLA
jgi:hypothetical protein